LEIEKRKAQMVESVLGWGAAVLRPYKHVKDAFAESG